MLFELKNATVAEVKDITNGTAKSGNPWTKATVIVEHKDGNFLDVYPMLCFGDRIQEADSLRGKKADVKFDLRSHEYNGRWYTELTLRYINPVQQEAKKAPAPEPAPVQLEEEPDGDLPF